MFPHLSDTAITLFLVVGVIAFILAIWDGFFREQKKERPQIIKKTIKPRPKKEPELKIENNEIREAVEQEAMFEERND
jgi:FtsZ-interacting cell division protein ZipA